MTLVEKGKMRKHYSRLMGALYVSGGLVKYSILILFLVCSFSSAAKDLCPINKSIESDMRIPESHYSKENAEQAIKKLHGIVSENDKVYEWITVPNSVKTIEGYILKKDAHKSEFKLVEFCTFMKSSFWYD